MAEHPVETLRTALRSEFQHDLPTGVCPVTDWVADPQFFPGASGLLTEDDWEDVAPGQAGFYAELPPAPTGGVIVIGNYFASVATYERVRTGKMKGLKRT